MYQARRQSSSRYSCRHFRHTSHKLTSALRQWSARPSSLSCLTQIRLVMLSCHICLILSECARQTLSGPSTLSSPTGHHAAPVHSPYCLQQHYAAPPSAMRPNMSWVSWDARCRVGCSFHRRTDCVHCNQASQLRASKTMGCRRRYSRYPTKMPKDQQATRQQAFSQAVDPNLVLLWPYHKFFWGAAGASQGVGRRAAGRDTR